jgi:hypothetical protein
MPVSSAFIRAWRDWLRTGTPITNSRHRRFKAATYDVELALDHLDSRLYMIGLALLEGKAWDFAKLASEELSELDRVSCDLEALALNKDEYKDFDNSISASRALLMEVLGSASVRKGEPV